MRQVTSLKLILVVGICLLLAVSAEALANPPNTTPPPCTNCVVGTIPTGSGSGALGSDIAYDSANGLLYVSSSDLDSWGVTVINGSTDTIVRTIPDSGRPIALAYDARNGDIYVANWAGNNVTIIDGMTDEVVGSIPLPPQQYNIGPSQIVYDPFNGFLDLVEVPLSNPPAIEIIDGSTNQIVASLNFSVNEDAIATNPVNGEIYAASGGTEEFDFNLDVLNGSTGSLISSLPLNGTAASILYDTGNGQVYVVASGFGFPDFSNGTVTEVNSAASRIEGVWPAGQNSLGIAYDDSNANLYVTNYYSANVSILNTSARSVAGSISTEWNPGPIVYDAANRCLYTVHLEGLVSILAPPGSSCPAIPVPAFNGPLVLSVSGLAGLVLAAGVFVALMARRSQLSVQGPTHGGQQSGSGEYGRLTDHGPPPR
jgi:YVTN family beta-propeller protein